MAIFPKHHRSKVHVLVTALLLAAGTALAQEAAVKLSGDAEVPPVSTMAAGSGSITVAADKSVSGMVMTNGITGSMAHIHLAAAGKNGGVIIPLTNQGDGHWVVAAGAKLTDAQYEAFKAGELYVNVHSAAHPGGEIRAQLRP
jgi:hypothetical protein